MKKNAIYTWLGVSLLVVLQAWLGTLDEKTITDTHVRLLYNGRPWIVPSIALLIVILDGISRYKTPAKLRHQFRSDMLKTMRKTIFDNDRDVRISIFKDVWWIRVLFTYFWKNISHPVNWYRSKSRYTYPKKGKYIKVSERVGTEHSISNTYFWLSKTTSRECEGVAAVARHEHAEKVINDLPDIKGIDLFSLDLSSNSQEALVVNRYIKESLVQNVESLKRVHIPARHLYANVLLDKNANTVAVLVIDSSAEKSPFTEGNKSKIGGYIELFTSTFV